jgi:hypothetical protein
MNRLLTGHRRMGNTMKPAAMVVKDEQSMYNDTAYTTGIEIHKHVTYY